MTQDDIALAASATADWALLHSEAGSQIERVRGIPAQSSHATRKELSYSRGACSRGAQRKSAPQNPLQQSELNLHGARSGLQLNACAATGTSIMVIAGTSTAAAFAPVASPCIAWRRVMRPPVV